MEVNLQNFYVSQFKKYNNTNEQLLRRTDQSHGTTYNATLTIRKKLLYGNKIFFSKFLFVILAFKKKNEYHI